MVRNRFATIQCSMYPDMMSSLDVRIVAKALQALEFLCSWPQGRVFLFCSCLGKQENRPPPPRRGLARLPADGCTMCDLGRRDACCTTGCRRTYGGCPKYVCVCLFLGGVVPSFLMVLKDTNKTTAILWVP